MRQRLLNFPDALFSLLLTDTIVLQYTLRIMITLSIDFQTLNTVKQTGSLHPGAISIHKWLMKCCNSPTYLFVLSSILLSYLAHSQSKPKKILKNPLPKKLLIFPEMELSSSNIKKIIFSQKKSSYISGNGTPHFLAQNRKIKKMHPKKKKPSKKSLYFRKRNFFMFQERNIQNLYISPVLQEVTFRAQKIKKMCFIVFLPPKKLNKTPLEETGCLSSH